LGDFSPNYNGASAQKYLSNTAVRIQTDNGIVTLEHAISPYAGGFLLRTPNTLNQASPNSNAEPTLSGVIISKDGAIQQLWIRDGASEQAIPLRGFGPQHPFKQALLPLAHALVDDVIAAPAQCRYRSSAALENTSNVRWFLDSDVAEAIRGSGGRIRIFTDHFIDGGLFSSERREVVDTTRVRVTAPGYFPWPRRTLAVIEISQVQAPELEEPYEILRVTRFGVHPSGRGLEKVFEGTVAGYREALAELDQVPHQLSLLSLR
jgi:hypothetical protein